MAHDYGLLYTNNGLLWGIVAVISSYLAVQGDAWIRAFAPRSVTPANWQLLSSQSLLPSQGATESGSPSQTEPSVFQTHTYLESQSPIILGYFQSIAGYFVWGIVACSFGPLAFQVPCPLSGMTCHLTARRTGLNSVGAPGRRLLAGLRTAHRDPASGLLGIGALVNEPLNLSGNEGMSHR